MRLLRSFPFVAFVMVMMAIAGLCAAHENLGFLLFAGVLAAMSWYVTQGPRGHFLPRWTSHVLTIAACLYVPIDVLQNPGEVMKVLGRFAIWLTLIKLYERKGPRDYAQLLALSLLLMLVGAMSTDELLFGLMLVVYAVLGVYVLVLYQLWTSFERTKAERQESTPADYYLIPPLKPVLGRHVGWHFRGVVTGVAVGGIVLSVVVWLAFPRGVGVGFLGRVTSPFGTAESGFSESISLGTGSVISESPRRALRVRVLDESGNATRIDEAILLRGEVQDEYQTSGEWRPKNWRTQTLDVAAGEWLSLDPDTDPEEIDPADPDILTLEVTMLSPGDRLFAPYPPLAVKTRYDESIEYTPETQTMQLSSARRQETYTVLCHRRASYKLQLALTRNVKMDVGRRFHHPRVEALARRLLEEAGLAQTAVESGSPWKWHRDAANAFLQYLQADPFRYDLDLSDLPPATNLNDGDDQIVGFLLDFKRGHCEYFATGMVALCQSVGIDARTVTGYRVEEWDPESTDYIVRDRHAHAWAEVRTSAQGWSTYDPSPPAGLQAVTAEAVDEPFIQRVYSDFDEDIWSIVSNFDSVSQHQLAESLNSAWVQAIRDSISDAREWFKGLSDEFLFDFGPIGLAFVIVSGTAIVICLYILVRLIRRSRLLKRHLQLQHVRGAEYQRMLRQLGFYLDMLKVLRRHGSEKPLWQPPLAFAHDLAEARPEVSTAVRRITSTFYAARYGRLRLSRSDVHEATEAVRELDARLKASP